MKTKIKNILIIMLTGILINSCQHVKYGVVEKKWHEPAHRHSGVRPIPMAKGVVSIMPYSVYINDRWCIKVNYTKQNGNIKLKKYYVSKQEFDSLYVGQNICLKSMKKKKN